MNPMNCYTRLMHDAATIPAHHHSQEAIAMEAMGARPASLTRAALLDSGITGQQLAAAIHAYLVRDRQATGLRDQRQILERCKQMAETPGTALDVVLRELQQAEIDAYDVFAALLEVPGTLPPEAEVVMQAAQDRQAAADFPELFGGRVRQLRLFDES